MYHRRAEYPSPHYLTGIQQAFPVGPVFGRHYHYAGGSSTDNWAFRTFEPFWHYVTRSKPGDLYVMWSLPDLLAKGVALLHLTRFSPGGPRALAVGGKRFA